MKKLLLFGFVVLLMICGMPVSALTAADDWFFADYGGCFLGGDIAPRTIGNVLDNDMISDPGSITIEITQQPKFGRLEPFFPEVWYSINNRDFVGTDTFYYRLYDGQSYSNVAEVTITVFPRIHNPARAWLYTPPDTALNSRVCQPWGPDDTIISSTVTHGELRFLDDYGHSDFEYTPDAGFTGWDKFTYMCHIDSAEYGDCFGRESEAYIYVGNGHPAPEFPSVLLPVTMIFGFFGSVWLIKRTKE